MADSKRDKIAKALLGPPQYRPFQGNEQRPNADGSYSTEITMTAPDPQGEWMNFPSLWMGPQGPTQLDNEDNARRMALMYEQFGYLFPRFDTLDEADKSAIARTHAGGVGEGPLAKTVKKK